MGGGGGEGRGQVMRAVLGELYREIYTKIKGLT